MLQEWEVILKTNKHSERNQQNKL